MRILDRIGFRLRAILAGKGVERDLEREMQFHVDMETAQNIRAGLPTGEAARRAHVAFGGRQRFREETRDELRSRALLDAMQDLRHAVRAFRRVPAFTLTVIMTLALGIGATTVIFSVTDHIVLRSLPYANADRLASVQILTDRLKNVTPTWPPNAGHYLAWKQGCTVCENIGALRVTNLTLSDAGDPMVLSVLRVSDDLLPMLGARAAIGRVFAPGDDRPGNEHSVVISDGLWRERMGGRTDIVGRTITMGDAPWTIVGVLSPDFHMMRGHDAGTMLRLPDQVDAYVPLALNAHERTTPGEHDYGVVALLKPGVTTEALRVQLDAIDVANVTRLQWPGESAERTAVAPLQKQVVGPAGRPLVLLLAAVGAMLLIMCVNLANLFLAWSAARRRESAVRVALGADRGRLVRQALTEAIALALVGGGIGIVLARWGVRALVALAPADLPRLNEVHLDGRVLAVALLVSAIAGLSFGIVPALRFAHAAPDDVLKEGSRAASDGRRSARLRSSLIASQVALSALLLIAAGVFLRSLVRVLHVDKGFTADKVLAMNIVLPGPSYRTIADRNRWYADALPQLAALPGVVAAGLTNALPLEGESWVDGLRAETTPAQSGQGLDANFRFVSPNFFDLMGVRLTRGRGFSEADRGQHRVILSEKAARALWPTDNPIGKRVHAGSDALAEVIGVAADVRTTGMEHEGSLTVYWPYWERGYAPTILLRTSGDPAAVAGTARALLHRIAPTVPIAKVRTIGDVISSVVAQRRFEAVLIAAFALAALITASIGIYGIISYSLARRKNDICIRMALGASPTSLQALVFGETLVPVGVGILVGTVASALVGRTIAALLFEVRPTDGLTLATVLAILGTVAAIACWIPSRRMTRLDPADALRAS